MKLDLESADGTQTKFVVHAEKYDIKVGIYLDLILFPYK